MNYQRSENLKSLNENGKYWWQKKDYKETQAQIVACVFFPLFCLFCFHSFDFVWISGESGHWKHLIRSMSLAKYCRAGLPTGHRDAATNRHFLLRLLCLLSATTQSMPSEAQSDYQQATDSTEFSIFDSSTPPFVQKAKRNPKIPKFTANATNNGRWVKSNDMGQCNDFSEKRNYKIETSAWNLLGNASHPFWKKTSAIGLIWLLPGQPAIYQSAPDTRWGRGNEKTVIKKRSVCVVMLAVVVVVVESNVYR